jgi:CheY-like chemotaxis protein
MEQSLPSPPRTIIVVDDAPIDVSFIRSVLDAHALPYKIRVVDHSDYAFDVFGHRTQHESLGAPTVILLDCKLPQRDGQALWRRLKALWPSSMLQRMMMRLIQRHTAASLPRWRRGLAWGVGLGFLIGCVWSASSLWLSGWLPRVPISPQRRSDHVAAALLVATPPTIPPAAVVRPPTQSQTLAERPSVTGTARGSTPSGVPLQRPTASVTRNAARLRPHAAAQPRAARAERPRSTRRRYALLRPETSRHLIQARDDAGTSTRPRAVGRDRVVGAHHPGEWSTALPGPQPPWWQVAPDPAPEPLRPWDRRIVNDTGV